MLAPSARPHPSLRATFPLEGEGFFRRCEFFLFCFSILPQSSNVSTARPPSSVASRHLLPRRGRLPSVVRIFSVLLLNPTDKSALSLTTRDCRSSLPPGGEGGAPATDEGEIGEWNHFMHPSRRSSLFLQRRRLFGWNVALCGTSQQARSRLLAPRLGRGSLCGNVWISHMIFSGLCRFAQDDTVGRRGVVRSLLGWKYSSVNLISPPHAAGRLAETGGYFCDLEMSRSNFSIARGRPVLTALMRVEYTMDGSMMLLLRIDCVLAKLFRKFRSTYR